MTLGAKLVTLAFMSLAAVCAAGGWLGYQLFTTGFSAKTEPHAIEVLMARHIRRLAIPIENRNARNPIPLSPDVRQEALAHFAAITVQPATPTTAAATHLLAKAFTRRRQTYD
jgi:hypothetical protein